MKKNFLTIMFTAVFVFAALLTVSCGDTPSDEATDETQTEITDEEVSDESVVEDAESHEGQYKEIPGQKGSNELHPTSRWVKQATGSKIPRVL